MPNRTFWILYINAFFYCFSKQPNPGVAHLELKAIENLSPFTLFGIDIEPVRVWHYRLPIIGYRIGRFAYITDMLTIPDGECAKLSNLDTLVVNALRHKPHISHQNLESALTFIAQLNPEQAYITHMSHQIGFMKSKRRSFLGMWLLPMMG